MLSTARLNAIRAVDRVGLSITAEAGCILADVQQAARLAGLWLPLSLASQFSCRLGGVVAANAGGLHVLRYGMTRNLVLGLEAVLPDGRIFSRLAPLAKDNCGYDLKQLFIGSEGTLGVITAVTLKLYPQPGQPATALAAVSGIRSALALLALSRGRGRRESGAPAVSPAMPPATPIVFEYINAAALALVCAHCPPAKNPFAESHPGCVLLTVDGEQVLRALLATALDAGIIQGAVCAASLQQAERLSALREAVGDAQRRAGGGLKHDVALPLASLASFAERADALVETMLPGASAVVFGHLGDGNLHYNVAAPPGVSAARFAAQAAPFSDALYGTVLEMDGGVSAEHGIGRFKKSLLKRARGGAELALMRRIRRAFDPAGIMNPGVMFDRRTPGED